MAEQMRPSSPGQAPNPAHSYERTDPNRESGQGKLDSKKSTPSSREDDMQQSAPNKKAPDRQINAQESPSTHGDEPRKS